MTRGCSVHESELSFLTLTGDIHLNPLSHPTTDQGTVLTAAEARAAGLSRPFYVVALLALVLGIN
ncbi:MAG: hypothetical protein JOZ89_10235, partial [Gammaproteobacteria bacterium]|nr:hypothetical protein [Gammaproteobacteria bacterium]